MGQKSDEIFLDFRPRTLELWYGRGCMPVLEGFSQEDLFCPLEHPETPTRLAHRLDSRLSTLALRTPVQRPDIILNVLPIRHSFVHLTFVLTSAILGHAVAQGPSEPLPTFRDYPVKEFFDGMSHPPILLTPEQHRFRTRILEGVETGSGVWIDGESGKEQNKPGANFAGHYIVIVWGCGAACLRMAVSDAKTGTVYSPPLSAGGLALPLLMLPMSVGRSPDLEYRRDSRLMIVKATPSWDRPNAKSYTFYFLFQNNQWKLLRRVPITDDPITP